MTLDKNNTIHLTLFNGGLYDTTPVEKKVSWPKVYEHLTTIHKTRAKKHQVRGISFAEYGPNKTRANENVVAMHALVYDIDNTDAETPLRPEDLRDYETGESLPFAHAYYSTYSHGKDDVPRWRLVIPLSHPVDVDHYQSLYKLVASSLGLDGYYDPSCSDPSRLFYDSATPRPGKAFCGGRADLPRFQPVGVKAPPAEGPEDPDPLADLMATGQEPEGTDAPKEKESLSGLINYVSEENQRSPDEVWNLLKFIDPDSGEATWKRVILALQQHFKGSNRSEIGLEIAHQWSSDSAVYDEKEIDQMWQRDIPEKAASFGSLVHLAKQNGYVPPPTVDWGAYRFDAIGPLYLAQNLPEPEWMVQDLINLYALGMLSGQGGIGKSMLFMQLCTSLASGTPFLGYKVPRPHRVIYMNAEDSTMKFARRLTAYRDLTGIPAEPLIHNLHYYGAERTFQRLTGPKGLNKKAIDALIHSVNAAKRPDPSLPTVIIFDPFIQFISGSENDNAEMNNGIVAFRKLQSATNSTVLFGHHEAKRPAGAPLSSNGHSGRGASAIYDGARQAFKLRWQDDDEIESILGIQAADITRDEKTRFIALEHTKADEGEIRGDVLLRRGVGGTLSVASKLTIEERRALAETFMLEQEWREGEEAARDRFVDRYVGLLVRGMAPTQTDLKRSADVREGVMGKDPDGRPWTRDSVEKWINWAVMTGRLRRLSTGRLEAVGIEGSTVYSPLMEDMLS